MRLTGNLARAQELTQETFLRAFRTLEKGEVFENPQAWLFRVASRLAIDEHRRKGRFPDQELGDLASGDDGSDEGAILERVMVQAALNALPTRYRIPLVLYVYEDWQVAEIARVLGLSVSAVKMRLHRAREMFRKHYGEERK